MNKIGFVLVFVFLVFSGCENGLYAHNDHNSVPVSNVRSVAYDPAANCAIEQVDITVQTVMADMGTAIMDNKTR